MVPLTEDVVVLSNEHIRHRDSLRNDRCDLVVLVLKAKLDTLRHAPIGINVERLVTIVVDGAS